MRNPRQGTDFRFDNYQDLVDYAESPTDMKSFNRHSLDGSGNLHGVSFKDALHLARNGWPEGAKRVERIMFDLSDDVQPLKHRVVPTSSVVGPGVLDMGNYLRGYPEPWIVQQDSEQEIEASRGIIRVCYNLSEYADASAESLFLKGAAVCSVVDALETAGYRCEITVVDTAKTMLGRGGLVGAIYAPIKQADQPLEIESLVFAIANVASLRRIMFSVWEHYPSDLRDKFGIGGTYGYPCDITDSGEYDIYVGSAIKLLSPEYAKAWVKSILRQYGVEVE